MVGNASMTVLISFTFTGGSFIGNSAQNNILLAATCSSGIWSANGIIN